MPAEQSVEKWRHGLAIGCASSRRHCTGSSRCDSVFNRRLLCRLAEWAAPRWFLTTPECIPPPFSAFIPGAAVHARPAARGLALPRAAVLIARRGER